jgi:hypothetical protein
VVEPPITHDVPQRPDCTCLRVPCAEHHAAHPREHGRARAHRARLQGDGERATDQLPVAEHLAGPSQGDHLGMRRRVVVRLPLVVRLRDHRTGRVEDDRTDWHLAQVERGMRDDERRPDGGAGGGSHARSASNWSTQPAFSHTATSTSTGNVPWCTHMAMRSLATVPRSLTMSASPKGALSCTGGTSSSSGSGMAETASRSSAMISAS